MNSSYPPNGFTLIELVVVIVILGIAAAVAVPKFVDLRDDADQVVLENFKGLILSAANVVFTEIQLRPENRSNNNSRYNFADGTQIRIRANYPDGRWNNTFRFLLDVNDLDIVQVGSNNCTSNDLCVRQRGRNWFANRGYTTASSGRGFVIFPRDNNVNNDECYVYYFTPNGSAEPANPLPPIADFVDTEC